MSLKSISDRLFDLEKAFRELTTDLQLGRASWKEVSDKIFDAREEMRHIADEAERIIESPYVDAETRDVARALIDIANKSEIVLLHLLDQRDDCEQKGIEPKRCTVDMRYIIDFEDEVKALTGKPCAWKVSNAFTSALNDFAACIHRVAEEVTKMLKVTVIGKCYILPDASSEAAELCKIWDRMTELLMKNELYAREDYEELHGWAVGNRVYLRVGSAAGHATEIDFNEGTLKYYDTTDGVNKMMREALERHAGLSCNVIPKTGVECKGVTKENYRRVAEVIAFATSMDFRLGDSEFYMETIAKHFDEFKKLIGR